MGSTSEPHSYRKENLRIRGDHVSRDAIHWDPEMSRGSSVESKKKGGETIHGNVETSSSTSRGLSNKPPGYRKEGLPEPRRPLLERSYPLGTRVASKVSRGNLRNDQGGVGFSTGVEVRGAPTIVMPGCASEEGSRWRSTSWLNYVVTLRGEGMSPLSGRRLQDAQPARLEVISHLYDGSPAGKICTQVSQLYGKKVTAQMTAGAVGQPRLDKAALMAKRRAVRKACWESETEAVKEEVRAAMKLEKEQQEARGAMEVSLGIEKRSPMQIQEALDQLKPVLYGLCQEVYNLTGWTLVCLAGGPMPDESGQLVVSSVNTASDESKHTFISANSDFWYDTVGNGFADWLEKAYPEEVRCARALDSGKPDESSPIVRIERDLSAPDGLEDDDDSQLVVPPAVVPSSTANIAPHPPLAAVLKHRGGPAQAPAQAPTTTPTTDHINIAPTPPLMAEQGHFGEPVQTPTTSHIDITSAPLFAADLGRPGKPAGTPARTPFVSNDGQQGGGGLFLPSPTSAQYSHDTYEDLQDDLDPSNLNLRSAINFHSDLFGPAPQKHAEDGSLTQTGAFNFGFMNTTAHSSSFGNPPSASPLGHLMHIPDSRPAPNPMREDQVAGAQGITSERGRGRGRGHGRGGGRGRGGGHRRGGAQGAGGTDGGHVNHSVDSGGPDQASAPMDNETDRREEVTLPTKRSRLPPKLGDGSYAPQASITAAHSNAARGQDTVTSSV
ncbi:hypothetical protein BJ912DRAFT_928565 [Pholiota molesta]|nr:hypothetical protein BJ912DRAFT_928565 [Pholiota molesta]